MLIDLTEDTLQDLVTTNNKVVVQYSASWCGNCRIMKPKFKKLASENDAITFVLVDAENSPESRKLANVSNLPTFATFVNGELVNQTQTNKAEVLAELVSEISAKLMKLPVIKHLTQFIEDNDQDYLVETIEVLEALTEISSLKEEELDVIGELISNMYGALEVQKSIQNGMDKKEALNGFMKRVLGSIDK